LTDTHLTASFSR